VEVFEVIFFYGKTLSSLPIAKSKSHNNPITILKHADANSIRNCRIRGGGKLQSVRNGRSSCDTVRLELQDPYTAANTPIVIVDVTQKHTR
jgi:hypothetical protein